MSLTLRGGGGSYEVKYGNLIFDQKLLIFLNENV